MLGSNSPIRRWFLLGGVLALVSPTPVVAAPALENEGPTCGSLDEGEMEVSLRWGRVRPRRGGCVFFIGPRAQTMFDIYGSRARYTRSGDQVSLRLGSKDFEGTVVGRRVRLRHPWPERVEESIRARFVEVDGCTILRGTYFHQECSGASCSRLNCNRTASLEISPTSTAAAP